MAITENTHGTLATNSAASTTLNIPYPATVEIGHFLLAIIGFNGATAGAVPANWTALAHTNAAGNSPSVRMIYRIADDTDVALAGTNLAVTTVSNTSRGRMLSFDGVDLTNPIDVAVSVLGTASAITAYDLPSLVTTVPNCMLVYAADANSSSGAWTPPTVPVTFTEVDDVTSFTPTFTIGKVLWTGSGATGTVNLVRTGAASRGGGLLVALRPAPVVPSADTTVSDLPAFALFPDPALTIDLLPILQSGANKQARVKDVARNVKRVVATRTQFNMTSVTNARIPEFDITLEPGTWCVKYLVCHWSNSNSNGQNNALLNCNGGTVTMVNCLRTFLSGGASGTNTYQSTAVAGSFYSMNAKGQRGNNSAQGGIGNYDVTLAEVISIFNATVIVTATTVLELWMSNEIGGGNTNQVAAGSAVWATKVA